MSGGESSTSRTMSSGSSESDDSYPDYSSTSSGSDSETESDDLYERTIVDAVVSSSSSDDSDSEQSLVTDLTSEDNSSTQGVPNANSGSIDQLHLGLPAEFSSPLYDGAPLTILDSYILLLQYSLRHSLTKKAFSELIDLTAVHVPPTAKATQSLHKLVRVFSNTFEDVQPLPYWYCSKCHRPLEDKDVICPSGCAASVDEFISVPIGSQLKRKVQDPHIWKLLQQRFNHPDSDTIRDIYDGAAYKKYGEVLSRVYPANVSLLCNTDGVDIFKSSQFALWPIWVVINELPPMERFSKTNMMLAGLWYSKDKPTMTTYFMPLVRSMNEICDKGIKVETPDGQMTLKARLILCCVDLPAQCKVMNMKQYNGAFGCGWCEQEGTSRPLCPGQRNWPMENGVQRRPHESMMQCARDATSTGSPVKGIKGACVLCLHPPFDLGKGFAIDTLHTVFLGVVNDLLGYWFEKKHRNKPFSVRTKRKEFDERLLSIRVPDIISRAPKSIDELSKWKGSELRSWLLYYSLPTLHGLLPPAYLNHFALLVFAIHIVLSDEITSTDLSNVDRYLKKFYEEFPVLYGVNSATMKVHMMSHITDCVKDWGPMWAYSCFSFESHNRVVKNLFHGTKQMNFQLAFNHTMLQIIPSLIMLRANNSKDRIQVLLESLTGRKRMAYHQLEGQHDCYVLGRSSTVEISTLCAAHAEAICEYTEGVEQVRKLTRILLGKQVYFSKEYTRVRARNSYTVEFLHLGSRRVGIILFFIYIPRTTFAVIQQVSLITSVSQHFNLSNDCMDRLHCSGIIPVCISPTESVIKCIPVQNLIKKAVFIDLGSDVYVSTFPNNVIDD